MKSVDIPSYEKIAFIAYNIGVYESVQKFGGLITSGKIASTTDVAKIAELLSDANAFYDGEMISQLINTMLRHSRNPILDRIAADEVIQAILKPLLLLHLNGPLKHILLKMQNQ